MRICENKITDYTASNLTETETAWSDSATYNNGEEAMYNHVVYKYAGVNGTNTVTNPEENPTVWLPNRSTNYYAMLGDRTNEQTINDVSIQVDILLNRYDTLSLLNIEGDNLTIEVLDTDFIHTYDLTERTVYNYTTFFFAEFLQQENVYLKFPFFYGNTMRITLTGTPAKIGRLVIGTSQDLGCTSFGASFNLRSFSRNETDQFGATTLTKRNSVFDSQYDVVIPSQNIELLKSLRKRLDATPILFIGDESDESDFQSLLSYGLWQEADITLLDGEKSTMNLTIQELL